MITRTVNMSDAFWARIVDAPKPIDLDEDGNPVMGEVAWAKKWVFGLVKVGVERKESRKRNIAAQVAAVPIVDSDFVIE